MHIQLGIVGILLLCAAAPLSAETRVVAVQPDPGLAGFSSLGLMDRNLSEEEVYLAAQRRVAEHEAREHRATLEHEVHARREEEVNQAAPGGEDGSCGESKAGFAG